jgi:hypothetical protein
MIPDKCLVRKKMSVENLKSFFDAGAVVLLFVTFVFGAGALITGNVINKRQEEQLRGFDKSLTEAKTALSEAKAEQQKVETELNTQKARAAEAEIQLIRLKERLKWRTISADQRAMLLQELAKGPKGPVSIEYPADDPEALQFATQVEDVFRDSGWPPIEGGQRKAMLGDSNLGQGIIVHTLKTAPIYAARIQKAFQDAGIPFWGLASERRAETEVVVSIGHKKPEQ